MSSVNLTKKVAYGLSAPTVGVPNEPIIAQRSPTINDKAQLGQQWINILTQQIYFLALVEDNKATWVQIGGGGALTFKSGNDASTATPLADVITFNGAGGTVVSASGSTVTITSSGGGVGIVTLDGNTGSATGAVVTITTGSDNIQGTSVFTGDGATNIVQTFEDANNNVGIGSRSLSSGSLSGINNTAYGHWSGLDLTSGNYNTLIGSDAGDSLSTGSDNTCLGNTAGLLFSTGSHNTLLGGGAGTNYAGSESSNICIGSSTIGTLGESNTLRIGSGTSTSAGGLVDVYISGIQGSNVGSVASLVSISGDKLGETTITAGTGVSVTPGANTITLSTSNIASVTFVTTSPYTVLPTDYFLLVNSVSPVTLLFPNSPTVGTQYVVKDYLGRAFLIPITITTVGGTVLFDADPTLVFSTDYESVNLIFDGVDYAIF